MKARGTESDSVHYITTDTGEALFIMRFECYGKREGDVCLTYLTGSSEKCMPSQQLAHTLIKAEAACTRLLATSGSSSPYKYTAKLLVLFSQQRQTYILASQLFVTACLLI